MEPMDEPVVPDPSGDGVADVSEAMKHLPANHEVVRLVKEKIEARCVLTPRFVREIRLDKWRDMVTDNLTYMITGWVLKLPKRGTLRLPKTWWDGFKIEHFPEWLLRRYPAEYTTYEAEQFVKFDGQLPKGMEVTTAVFNIPKEATPYAKD